MKGDVNESQTTSMDDDTQITEDGVETKMYYMVHPSVDVNESASY